MHIREDRMFRLQHVGRDLRNDDTGRVKGKPKREVLLNLVFITETNIG
jgi:hypothetical protein